MSWVVIRMMQEAKWEIPELIQEAEQTKNLVKIGKEKSIVFWLKYATIQRIFLWRCLNNWKGQSIKHLEQGNTQNCKNITQQQMKEIKNLEIHNKLPWIYNESRILISTSKETCKISKNQISLDKHLALRL